MGHTLPNENSPYGVNGMAEAMKWVSVVTSVVGVMTAPPLGGIWIDSLLGIRGVVVILGAILGVGGGRLFVAAVRGVALVIRWAGIPPRRGWALGGATRGFVLT